MRGRSTFRGATRDYFADDDQSAHQTDINRLAESGITSGCAPGSFCPAAGITRGQMAAFLHRALTAIGAAGGVHAAPRDQRLESAHRRPADSQRTRRRMISTIGAGEDLHPDFGEYLGYGIPYNVVGSSTPRTSVSFDYDDESDAGPYPIPPSPRIEGGGDRHILMWDIDACRLYELFAAERSGSGWHAGSGAIWDLRSNALRPDGWTSADAAGLPILPGPGALRGGGRRRDRARHPLHGSGHAQRAHLPGSPRRRSRRLGLAAADGHARAPEGRLRHERLQPAACR